MGQPNSTGADPVIGERDHEGTGSDGPSRHSATWHEGA